MIKNEKLTASIVGWLNNGNFIMSEKAREKIAATERTCNSSVGKKIDDIEIMY